MKKLIRNTVLALSTTFCIGITQAAVIDFSAAPAGLFASYTEQGVTFTASGGGARLSAEGTSNGTRGLIDNSGPRKELRADIAGGASSVSVDLGDNGQDAETIFLEIFNTSDVLLNSVFLDIGVDATMHTLSLANPNIAYAIFGSRLGNNGSSVAADNFTFVPRVANVVPEPGSLVLFGLALTGLFGVTRRKQK